MNKYRFVLTTLFLATLIAGRAQTRDSLPQSLYYVNPVAKPFIERVYAKFPKQTGIALCKRKSHYYLGFGRNSQLISTLSEQELNEWKDILYRMSAKSKNMEENYDNGIHKIDYRLQFESGHNQDMLSFRYLSYGFMEMKYLCEGDALSNKTNSTIPESVRIKIEQKMREFISNRQVDAYNFLIWNQTSSNFILNTEKDEDNTTIGTHYVIHNCSTKDYNDFVRFLRQIGKDEEKLEIFMSFDNDGNPTFAMPMSCSDWHLVILAGGMKGTDFHIGLVGGTWGYCMEFPDTWKDGFWDLGKIDPKQNHQGERIYDPATVGTLPLWRTNGQPSWNNYLKKFGLRNCVYDEDDGVVVMFTILKDGSITDAKVLLDKSNTKDIADQVLQIIREMPKWTPATSNGLPVSCRFVLRIRNN